MVHPTRDIGIANMGTRATRLDPRPLYVARLAHSPSPMYELLLTGPSQTHGPRNWAGRDSRFRVAQRYTYVSVRWGYLKGTQ